MDRRNFLKTAIIGTAAITIPLKTKPPNLNDGDTVIVMSFDNGRTWRVTGPAKTLIKDGGWYG